MKLDQTKIQILEHLAKGLTAKEISKETSISVPMIKYITRQLRIEIGLKNNIELALWFNAYQKIVQS